MERIYNENFNITINAVYDSLQKLGINDYDSKVNEGRISFCDDSIKLTALKGKTKIVSEKSNSLIEALLDEINISLGEDK